MQDDWFRLYGAADRRFRLQKAALIEYARAMLPTRLSRRVVFKGQKDPSAMPAEIWQCGDNLALIWHVRHECASVGSAPRRVVGFMKLTAGLSFDQFDFPPREQLPHSLGNVELVHFVAQFWQSDRPHELGESSKEQFDPPANADSQLKSKDASVSEGSDEKSRIKLAQEVVDQAFREHVEKSTSLPLVGFKLIQTTTPEAATGWRLQDELKERERVASLLKKAGVCNFHLKVGDQERVLLLEREVPFYLGCRLYRVIDMRGPRSRFASFVLHHESADLAALSTESAPIHYFNERRIKREELVIDEHSVAAYLRFFGEFVQGGSGAFPIIESSKEIRWLSQSDKKMMQIFKSALLPVELYCPEFGPTSLTAPPTEIESQQARKVPPLNLYCRAFVGYGRQLFSAGFAVHKDGSLEMIADSGLHESELPIQPLSFNKEFQFQLRMNTTEPNVDSWRG
ncbi:hypothetical protein [uncultured Zoogloea sp.]|uniref:hypothetical protein n=1 Tax=uncultured Zoogloea sp. TaxID=160237 RepID=UPI0026028007|nr:hypothetical protein [uncultured Zoogloea sp.]